MKFEKWWNEDYESEKTTMGINYFNDLKLGMFKKISKNIVYSKCKKTTTQVSGTSSSEKTGSTGDDGGYMISIWLKYQDENLLSIIKKIVFQIGFKGVTSLTDSTMHGFLPGKSQYEGPKIILNKFLELLKKENSDFTTEIELN